MRPLWEYDITVTNSFLIGFQINKAIGFGILSTLDAFEKGEFSIQIYFLCFYVGFYFYGRDIMEGVIDE